AAADLAAHPAGAELPRLILIDHNSTSHPSRKGLCCRFAPLAARAEIGHATLLPVRADPDRRSAAWTGSSATAMDRVALAGDRRHEVATHQLARRQVELAKPGIIHVCAWHPGIQPERPERLALIDVADAGTDPLLEQQLPEGGRIRAAGAADNRVQIESVDQDVGYQLGDRCLRVAKNLHHGRRE